MNYLVRAMLVALAALSFHCAPIDDDELTLESSLEALTTAPRLGAGERTTIASITGAENQLFTSNGRLLITGDKGVFELKKNASGTWERITLLGEQGSPFCQFGGIVEAKGHVYVNCYGVTQSFVFASKLGDEKNLKSIDTLSGRGFANGLTADDLGRLYIATTWQNQILRLTPDVSNRLVIASRDTYHSNAGGLVNGLAHHKGDLYWTDVAAIKRNTVDRAYATFKTVVAEWAYFDDLYVDDAGILAADAGNNRVLFYALSGAKKDETGKIFSGPSSVGRALARAGLSHKAIVVTERAGNRVSVFEPN